jgi:hypothetical protein
MSRSLTKHGRAVALALICVSAFPLAARGDDSFDPASQIGPNPKLPEPQQ